MSRVISVKQGLVLAILILILRMIVVQHRRAEKVIPTESQRPRELVFPGGAPPRSPTIAELCSLSLMRLRHNKGLFMVFHPLIVRQVYTAILLGVKSRPSMLRRAFVMPVD